jgi:hypothetical protein
MATGFGKPSHSNNTLFTYNPSLGAFVNPVQVTGIKGNLQGIDFRPANNLLYGITDTDQIYIIDPSTGVAKFVSTIPTSFDAGFQSLMDFNPVLDALRLIGSNDQNLAVVNAPNADLSVTNPQLSLVYADGDRNEGVDPNITAGAYNNNVAGARQTALFNIDSDKDVLTMQNPTANGINMTIGSLGVNFAPVAGMDIYTNAQGTNAAVAVSGTTLYCINLNTGAATVVQPLNPPVAPIPIPRVTGGGLIDVAVSTVQNTLPTITSFSPTSGSFGTQVAIAGTNLNTVSSVLFNGTEARFNPISSTQITAFVPLGATTGPITVKTATGSATSTNNFVVANASTFFSPMIGSVGTRVTIVTRLLPLTPDTVVLFNGRRAVIETIDFNDEFIVAIVPPGATTGPVTVTNSFGSDISASNFVVTA